MDTKTLSGFLPAVDPVRAREAAPFGWALVAILTGAGALTLTLGLKGLVLAMLGAAALCMAALVRIVAAGFGRALL